MNRTVPDVDTGMKNKISDKLFGAFLRNVLHAREHNLRRGRLPVKGQVSIYGCFTAHSDQVNSQGFCLV